MLEEGPPGISFAEGSTRDLARRFSRFTKILLLSAFYPVVSALKRFAMRAVNVMEMRMIERNAIDAGITEADLMESAGQALGHAIARCFPSPGSVIGYLGKGHNAGDTLIALRILRNHYGWTIHLRPAFPCDQCAPLTISSWRALGNGQATLSNGEIPTRNPLILLDGLLGIGTTGPLREPLVSLAREMADLRNHHGASIASIDLPSGVDPDTGEIHLHAVVADHTFTVAAPKVGLLTARAASATGAISMVPVAALPCPSHGETELICPQACAFGKSPRPFDFHKGNAGRVAIFAGSTRYAGAAILTALGAIRGGAGLVTLHAPSGACDAIAPRLPPEAMLVPCNDPKLLLETNADALVIGPGLGIPNNSFQHSLRILLETATCPTVIDADALNFLASTNPPLTLHPHHLLTPHPGEFARLAPDLSHLNRESAARAFAERHPATLLLKGCRTLIARHGSPLRVNSTGTPEMSNGGQGDLLAGLLGALLASGLSTFDAASLGAWLCGRAAEIHCSKHGGPCTATDTANSLGLARRDWQQGNR